MRTHIARKCTFLDNSSVPACTTSSKNTVSSNSTVATRCTTLCKSPKALCHYYNNCVVVLLSCCFNPVISMSALDNDPMDSKPPARTKSIVDKQVDAATSLIASCKTLQQAAALTDEVIEEFESLIIPRKKRQKLIKQLRLVQQTNTLMAALNQSAGQCLSPVANVKYGVERKYVDTAQERQKLTDITNAQKRASGGRKRVIDSISPNYQSLKDFVAKSPKAMTQKPRVSKQTTSPNRTLRRKKIATGTRTDIQLPEIPPPGNGLIYTPTEAFDILSPLPRQHKRKVMLNIINKNQLCVSTEQTLYGILRKPRAKLQSWWKHGGRPRFLHLNDLAPDIKEQLQNQCGNSWGLEDIKNVLVERKKALLNEAGLCALQIDISDETVKNYRAMIAALPDISAGESIVAKTNRRYVADHSLRNAVSFLVMVSITHYIVGNICKTEQRNAMTEGARKLMDMVSVANGNLPVCPINPAGVLSTDDTAIYWHDGVDGNRHNRYRRVIFLSSSESLKMKGKHSNYHTQEKQVTMGGLRFKFRVTISATGLCAPIFIVVHDVDETELITDDSGILVLEIPGLAVGATIDPRNKETGYFALVRKGKNGENVDEKVQDWYLRHVYFPFLATILREEDGVEEGQDVPVRCASAGWRDGDWPQIKALISTPIIALAEQFKHAVNKHAAASSLVQQPADLSPAFKILHQLAKMFTSDIRIDILAKRVK
jgi:hypothetical protein